MTAKSKIPAKDGAGKNQRPNPLKLHELPRVTSRAAKRIGRGYGSGKGGHTTGRGMKGQKSRSKVRWWFEGGQLSLVKRLPFWRGKGRLQSLTSNPVLIKTGQLEELRTGTVVDEKRLAVEGYVKELSRNQRVKILAGGEKLTKKLTIKGLAVSKGARDLIIKAGGKVE